jgi:cytochrome c5
MADPRRGINMEMCNKQHKKSYKYKLSAQIALADIMADSKKKRKEIRYYFCKDCHGYHLTSQPKKGKINHND